MLVWFCNSDICTAQEATAKLYRIFGSELDIYRAQRQCDLGQSLCIAVIPGLYRYSDVTQKQTVITNIFNRNIYVVPRCVLRDVCQRALDRLVYYYEVFKRISKSHKRPEKIC